MFRWNIFQKQAKGAVTQKGVPRAVERMKNLFFIWNQLKEESFAI